MTLITSHTLAAKEIVDIDFETPLFCENQHRSIKYGTASSNTGRFNKFTDLAYFTDGYANVPVSNFYTTESYTVTGNIIEFRMKMLVGTDVHDYGPQKSGDLSVCRMVLEKGWERKIEISGGISSYLTDSFEVTCTLGVSGKYVCSTSDALSGKLKLLNPYGPEPLPFAKKFRYRAWSE